MLSQPPTRRTEDYRALVVPRRGSTRGERLGCPCRFAQDFPASALTISRSPLGKGVIGTPRLESRLPDSPSAGNLYQFSDL